MSAPTRVAWGAAWALALAGASRVAGADEGTSVKQACVAAAEHAQTQRDEGAYRAARGSLLECSRSECPRIVAQSCTKWLRELDESSPTVVLDARDEGGNDLTDVTVSFDGALLSNRLDGKPLEVDTGEHVFRFAREGSTAVEQRVVLRAGEKARVIAVTLRSTDLPVAAEGPPSNAPPRLEGPEPFLSARHVTAGSLVIAAVAAGTTAAFFAVGSSHQATIASRLRGELGSSSACANGVASSTCQALASAVHSQHDDRNAAVVLFAGAGGLAVAAAATWLLWPTARNEQVTGSVVPTSGGATFGVRGTF